MVYYAPTQLDLLLEMWKSYGIFSVVLPFSLVFAVVYAILQKSKILGAKHAIDAIVAGAVAVLSLSWDFMPRFFNELFPRVGMGIAILVSLAIFFGLFFIADIGEGNEVLWRNIGAITALIVLIVVLIQTAGGQVPGARSFWETYKGPIIAGIIVIGVIAFITLSHPHTQRKEK